MVDLSKLSDAELQSLYGQAQPSADLSKMSDAELKAAYGSPGDMALGLAKQAGVGVAKGIIGTVGTIPLISDVLHNAANKYLIDPVLNATIGKPAVSPDSSQPPNINQMFSPAGIQSGVETVTGPFRKPETTGEKYADTIGQFAPGLLGGGAGLARRALTQVVAPGVASEALGQATEGTASEPYARVAGALLAPAAVGAARSVITPFSADPARQRLVDILHGEGVTSLTAGQRTGNKRLQYAESALSDSVGSGGGAQRIQQEGQRQFTEAAMRRAGAGPTATPEVLADNQQRLGDAFRDLSARNNLNFDPQFGQDIVGAIRNYQRVPPSQQRAIVEGYVQDISQHLANGQMPGPQYQEMRSRLSRQANSLRNSDPTLSDTLRGMRNALDNAMGRSISPQDQAAWQLARQQYAAQKTIEKAASRAGEATAEGQIVPANLRNAVSAENRGAYARGQGPFSELARAGSGIMAPLPQSGTAPRAAITALASLIGGGAGSPGGPAGMSIGAALGAALGPAALSRAVMSRPVQAYLGNQLLRAGPGDTPRDAIVRALLASNGGQSLLPRQ
jgi:hypothetical protein